MKHICKKNKLLAILVKFLQKSHEMHLYHGCYIAARFGIDLKPCANQLTRVTKSSKCFKTDNVRDCFFYY